MTDRIWKIHDHGKVTFVYNLDQQCEENEGFSYVRLGLYYQTKKGPQNFCDVHVSWNLTRDLRKAFFTGPTDSAMGIDTSRDTLDRLGYQGKEQIVYDKSGHVALYRNGYSPRLDVANGGRAVIFGDPRLDAALKEEAKAIHIKDAYKDRIGTKRTVECWLLGPLFLYSGDTMSGSIVVKCDGRFEPGGGFQTATLWESHYIDDDTLEGGWSNWHQDQESVRKAVSAKSLPPFATGLAWKLEQYKANVTECNAKALSG